MLFGLDGECELDEQWLKSRLPNLPALQPRTCLIKSIGKKDSLILQGAADTVSIEFLEGFRHMG